MRVANLSIRGTFYTNYIGRQWAGHRESIFHNPFHVGQDGNRKEVLEKFIVYWYADDQRLLRRMAVLTLEPDAVLGCWCSPHDCHGDIIIGYLNWKRQEPTLYDER